MIAIYVMPNHVHVFISLNPKDSISNVVAAFKSQSSGFIQRELIEGFSWQRGYGAFAVSKSHWDAVIRYIENQEAHHRAQTLQQEIRQMLEDQGVAYDERYLFDEVD